MNKEEAIRFTEDLETGAFHACSVNRHQITLDIQNLVHGNDVIFEEYWSHV